MANTGNSLSDAVAEEIRVMMTRRRISGRKLAEELGVSSAWVSYRLTGSQEIGLNDLQRIAEVLDVAVSDLLPRRLTEQLVKTTGEYGSQPDRQPVSAIRATEIDQSDHPNGLQATPLVQVPDSPARPARLMPYNPSPVAL